MLRTAATAAGASLLPRPLRDALPALVRVLEAHADEMRALRERCGQCASRSEGL